MRYLLLVLMLCLLGHQAFAQATPPAARVDSLIAAAQAKARAAAAVDTAAALHRLYAAKRQRGLLIAGGFVAVTALGIAIDQNRDNPGQYQGLVNVAFVVFVGVPVLAANFFYHTQYNHKKERRAIAAFEAHQLPAATKSRLQEKYFRPANSTVRP
jgi:hypothetical protein